MAELQLLLQALEQMRSGWAESDDARKTELWKNVHFAADDVRGVTDG